MSSICMGGSGLVALSGFVSDRGRGYHRTMSSLQDDPVVNLGINWEKLCLSVPK